MSLSAAVLSRRSLLQAVTTAVCGSILSPQAVLAASKAADSEWDLSPESWKQRLTPAAYNVLRQEGTERPITVQAAIWRCSPQRPSSTAEPAGPVSGSRSIGRLRRK